jgi:hypothetical protein
MSNQNQKKSLIELAREHMEAAGASPEQGVDIPEQPVSAPERAHERPVEGMKHQSASAPQPAPAPQPIAKDSFDSTIKDAIASLTSNIKQDSGWREVQLPSRGKAYIQSTGSVEIRPFTYEDERLLRSLKGNQAATTAIASLIERCVKGLDYPSMTLEDKNYILFKLREISYGDQYTIEAECGECNAKNRLSVNISQVGVSYAPDDYKEPMSVVLPDSEQEVVFVTPRCQHEQFLTDLGEFTDNMWQLMISVGEYKDERIKQEFLKATTVRDVSFLREAILKERYGMQKQMSYECAGCGAVNDSIIPFNESFFSAS